MSDKVAGEAVPEVDLGETGKENEADNGLTDMHGGKINHDNLMSQSIRVEGKKYFLDVRSNQRGQFLKVTETGRGGKRNTVILAGHVVGFLQKVLHDAINSNFTVPDEPLEEHKWHTVLSRKVKVANKRIYLDIMMNKNFRSLNIAEVSQKGKSAVLVSEKGWLQFERALTEIAAEFPVFAQPPDREPSKTVETRKVTLPSKTLYFDLLQNESEGVVLKLSEVRKSRRDSVFLPYCCFHALIELFQKLNEGDFESEIEGLEVEEPPKSDADTEKNSTIARKKFSVEGHRAKTFHLDFRSNEFGKFLRVTELKQGRSSAVFIPDNAFEESKQHLQEFLNLDLENVEPEE